MDDSILCNDTELGGISLDNLELDCPHTATDEECVAFAHGPIRWVHIDQLSREK